MNNRELEARIRTLEDMEEIKKLQRTYGYYLDNGMYEDMIDLFSEETESIEVSDHGVLLGKEGVRKFFNKALMGGEGEKPLPELSLHLHMQLQGVVNVTKDGNTANGRWQCLIAGVTPVAGVPRQVWGHGVYENEYIKEKGQWRFKKLYFNQTFLTPYEDGWLKTPVISRGTSPIKADKPSTAYFPYPSGYAVPYHWKTRLRKRRPKRKA